ncbi:poly(A) RNA polymerase GLD2-like [Phlebotomus papatasi]|uniref:poly(A) RNA polymerase GLD2-like n=1 Tax=Phlebotomus papatasi TaxID=29031 RepID=UPI0024840A73|nr:poly(A) RNA polymerase GLD2-like [Phlebotomus papatasi]
MYSSRNEIMVESQNDQQGQKKYNRPANTNVKRRNASGGQNVSTGGNKRRIQYQNNNKINQMLFPNVSDRRSYQPQGDLSPVIEITVGGNNKRASQYAGQAQLTSPGHPTGNTGPDGQCTNDDQMHPSKFHHPHYNRNHFHHNSHHHQNNHHSSRTGQYLYQGDGRNAGRASVDHKWHCSGWGACTCGYQKHQWSGRDYSRTPNQKSSGNFMYTEPPANSRSPTPSLKSESPPAMTPNVLNSPILASQLELNQLMTMSSDSQLSIGNRSHYTNGYESDSSHSSNMQQQQHQQQPYVTSCDYFFDLSSSSYQLGELLTPQQHQQLVASSQSSLSSSHTASEDQLAPGSAFSYELLPYISPRSSYGMLYSEPTLINHEMDGYLRKRFGSIAGSPSNEPRRGGITGFPSRKLKRQIVETPPDHFIARAHLVMTKKVPKQLLTGGQWDDLSQMVWNRFMGVQQTEETYVKKMNLWKSLFVYIRSQYPRFGLYLVGSTMTGFGADTSDVDMCLLSKYRTELEPRIEAIVNLTELQNFLALNKKYEMFHLIEAKVPILRFRDVENHIEVDLNYNNCVGIRNTHLLYWYSNMDWRVRPLALVVKAWAQYHCINNAKNSTISSYSLVLMVIHFLQVGVNPIILPCLHETHPEKFGVANDIRTININEQLKPFHSQNQQSLGELFLQFLEYFSNFDYSQYAISVRTASCLSIEYCRMQRSPKNDQHQWKHLCIEEPFDLTNTARSVYDSEVFEKIKCIFVWSWRTLEATMDLNAIFKPAYGYPFHSTPSR